MHTTSKTPAHLKILMWAWCSAPLGLAVGLTHLFRLLPNQDRSKIWYTLAYKACRGQGIPLDRALRLLYALGEYPKGLDSLEPKAGYPPLWWALASRVGQDPDNALYTWAQQAGVNIRGRHSGYDFLSAAIIARNRPAFIWGLSQGLPPDGYYEDPAQIRVLSGGYPSASEIESDLRSPLWHAVHSTSVDDPWWVETLVRAGARWEYPGPGGVSAAELDRDLNLGWNKWWTRKRLTDQVSEKMETVPKQKMPAM